MWKFVVLAGVIAATLIVSPALAGGAITAEERISKIFGNWTTDDLALLSRGLVTAGAVTFVIGAVVVGGFSVFLIIIGVAYNYFKNRKLSPLPFASNRAAQEGDRKMYFPRNFNPEYPLPYGVKSRLPTGASASRMMSGEADKGARFHDMPAFKNGKDGRTV